MLGPTLLQAGKGRHYFKHCRSPCQRKKETSIGSCKGTCSSQKPYQSFLFSIYWLGLVIMPFLPTRHPRMQEAENICQPAVLNTDEYTLLPETVSSSGFGIPHSLGIILPPQLLLGLLCRLTLLHSIFKCQSPQVSSSLSLITF